MAFSDLCHIGNAYKSVENESDQSDRIMEENSMVRDLITKILDETGPSEGGSSIKPPEKVQLTSQNQFHKPDGFNPPLSYPNNVYNYPNPTQNDHPASSGYNYNMQNGFNNSFGYDPPLLGVDSVDPVDVTPEQLNLLRLAAQEIGGAQFTNPKFENFNFFDQQQQRNPMDNMFPNNYNRPNSLNSDMSFNTNFENPYNVQRFPQNGLRDQIPNPENGELMNYLNQLQVPDPIPNSNPNMEFKMPDMNKGYQNDEFKMQDPKMFYNRSFQPPKNFNGEPNNFFMNDMAQMVERPPPNFEFTQPPMSYKPNGYHQNEFMQRRDIQANHQREFQPNGPINEARSFENGQNMQQAALMRQNQELARQMSMLMRNGPPPNQLNVDVSFLHENANFNLGLNALLGPSPNVPPPVMPSPMLDLPLLAPFYAMRNMRGAVTSSGILHLRLDACYEQWRQLERERKRTEARLALAFPGRAVSSSNSIPVPRLPPCPTRVDRLTVDMLREHTKVLTLMGKMETLRASVCVAQKRGEREKITVLKRGQDVPGEREGVDPETFDPASWKEQITHLAEIAPHSEVESAMLAWRSAVGLVQLARRRELQNNAAHDPILQLADAVKQLCVCARRARCAMWSDLTLTVALAPADIAGSNNAAATAKAGAPETAHPNPTTQSSTKTAQDQTNAKQGDAKDTKDKDKPAPEVKPEKPGPENNNNTKTTNKNEKPDNKRRPQNYRKVNGRNDFYQKNQRYDTRFMQNRHPYYLATGPIN